jgi:endogenous inhibitor of DNA gyrase (YacG/DUF329 family)
VSKCPTCGKTVEWQDNPSRPFCSDRCKLIDFGRWADEEYRVPGQQINPEAAEPPQADPTATDKDESVARGSELTID